MAVVIKVWDLPEENEDMQVELAGKNLWFVCYRLSEWLGKQIQDEERVKPSARKIYNKVFQRLLDEMDKEGVHLEMLS